MNTDRKLLSDRESPKKESLQKQASTNQLLRTNKHFGHLNVKTQQSDLEEEKKEEIFDKQSSPHKLNVSSAVKLNVSSLSNPSALNDSQMSKSEMQNKF